MMMKVVIATHNKDKLKELKKGFSTLTIDLVDLFSFPEVGEIIEDGKTLKENALIKAKAVYDITGLPAIADDTGLEVDALGGKPGVFTARFAGENCSYSDNVNKMLKVMKNIKKSERGAVFKTVMAFYDGKEELCAEGFVKGIITENKKGLAGFGYDPIFYVVEEGKTFAEMTIEQKNIISHRGRAIKNLLPKLNLYFNTKNTTKESA
jgi:XTP/dITP diphosphohydrolase